MRGLLGDATEEFIETLENKEADDKDEEDVYRLANVMSDCGGLEVMLSRMESVEDAQYSRQLLTVLLKLFGYCIKVSKNRDRLLDPQLRAIPVLLQCLRLSLASEEEAGAPSVAAASGSTTTTTTASAAPLASGPSSISTVCDTILSIMERMLMEAANRKDWGIDDYVRFATSGVTMDDIAALLASAVKMKSGTDLHAKLMRVLPFLTYACGDKMTLVVRHFDDVLDFETAERKAISAAGSSPVPGRSGSASGVEASGGGRGGSTEIALEEALAKKAQAFVALCEGIERNQVGNTMKVHMMELGIVDKCVKYITVSCHV